MPNTICLQFFFDTVDNTKPKWSEETASVKIKMQLFAKILYSINKTFFILETSTDRQTCSQVLTVRVQVQVRDSMSQPVFLVISKKFLL